MATYTYIADGITRTNKDYARELLGDTAVTAGTTTIPQDVALLSDEHIDQVITDRGSLAHGIAWLADELVTRFAQQPSSTSIGGISASWQERIDAWTRLAARMRSEGIAPVPPTTGRGPLIGRILAGTEWRPR